MRRTRVVSATTATAALVAGLVAASGTAYAHDNGAERQHAAPPLPAQVFAPYFEAYQESDSPAAFAEASGAKYLTMAFLQAPSVGSCDVTWNGDMAVSSADYGSDIAKIRAMGGDVVPSFGGYSADDTGTEIADSCSNVEKIAAAYEKVVTTYGVTRLDMDVEDNSLTNTAGIDRRNKAIALVEAWAKQTHRTVQFVYTLPTNVSGLDDEPAGGGVYVLKNAIQNHARVDIVNIMTFDYYDGNAHEMAADTKTAAGHLVDTLQTLYPHESRHALWRKVGITEMIGRDDYGSDPANDTGPKEIFTIDDAHAIEAWATREGITELSFWALQRDQESSTDCTVGTFGGDTCSGIAQQTWQFSHIMEPFTSNGDHHR